MTYSAPFGVFFLIKKSGVLSFVVYIGEDAIQKQESQADQNNGPK
jgi:hypothetical protein